MAATSPYVQNDYQAVSNFRPYQLPVNDIFRALSAQNEFWNEGARRIKSIYDNVLDLQLTNDTNKQLRDKYIADSQKELTKLSSMDVSDPSVQRQGFNVFKPIFQDEGIVLDDQATRWIQGLENDIRVARQKDNGKGYADSNAMVALEGTYEFRNSKDRMAGKEYLQKRRSYVPFYDASKEFNDILKNCKGGVDSRTVPGEEGEMYLHTVETSGSSPIRLKNCLNAGLSQKAKDQIGIDGYAAYMTTNRMDHPDGKNYQALRDDYVAYNKSALDGVDQEIKDLDGKILAFQEAYDKTKDPQYLDMKKAAEEARSNYLESATNLKNAFNEVRGGNLDFIKKNYASLAEQIFTHKKLETFAEAFNTFSRVEKYSADAVRLQQQKLVYDESKTQKIFQQQREMEEMRQKGAYELEVLKGNIKGKKVDAQGNIVDEYTPVSPAYKEESKISDGFDKFQKEKAEVISNLGKVNSQFFRNLQRKYPNELAGYTEESFFKQGPNGISAAVSFLDTHGKIAKDPDVAQWSSESATLSNQLDLLNTMENINEGDISTRETKLSSSPSIKVGNYILSEKDIQDAIMGRSKDLTIRHVQGKPSTTISPTTGAPTTVGGGTYMELVSKNTGGVIASQLTGENWENVRNVITHISSTLNTNVALRNSIYGRTMLELRPDVFAEANNIDEKDPTRGAILSAVGGVDIKDVRIASKNPVTGEATVTITGGTSAQARQLKMSEIKSRLSNTFKVDEDPRYNDATNQITLRITSPYLIDRQLSKNPLQILQLNLEKINLAVTDPNSSYGRFKPGDLVKQLHIVTKSYSGINFKIDIVRTLDGVKYELRSENKNDVFGPDGKKIKQKGSFDPAYQTFYTTNEMLTYINAVQETQDYYKNLK